MFQEQIGEITPSKLRQILSSSCFRTIFSPIPPKNSVLRPSQKQLFQINMQQEYLLKKFNADKLKIQFL